MPAAIAAVAAALSTTAVVVAGINITIGNIIAAALTIGSALNARSSAKSAARRAKAAYNASLEDRAVMFQSAVAARQVVYGVARVSGPIAYAQSTGAKREFLHVVIPVAAHEIDSFVEFRLGDEVLPAPDVNGFITSGTFAKAVTISTYQNSFSTSIVLTNVPTKITGVSYSKPVAGDADEIGTFDVTTGYTLSGSTVTIVTPVSGASYTVNYEYAGTTLKRVRIRGYTGAPGQVADPDLITESGGKWTADHRGDGVAYIYARFEYDQDIFGQIGVPNISAVVKGKKVYDPRFDFAASVKDTLSAVPGTPGTPPTGWTVNATAGISRQIVGSGYEDGLPYLDVRFFGTASTLTYPSVVPTNAATAAPGQSWAGAGYVKLVGGSLSGVSAVAVAVGAYNASGAFLGAGNGTVIVPNASALSTQRATRGAYTMPASTARAGVYWYLAINSGATVDVTLRVGFPTLWKTTDTADVVAWSDNNALCTADYLRSPVYGLGCPVTEVPPAEISAAANVCDELVDLDVGGMETQARYTCNGVIDTAVGQRDNLEQLVDSMAGSAVWVQGRWLVRAGAHQTPTMTITESMLAGSGVSFLPRPRRRERFNAVEGTFVDPEQGYVEKQFSSVENPTYVADDGGWRQTAELTLPLTNNDVAAQRLAKVLLERARQGLRVQLTCNLYAYDLAPGSVVAVTLSRYGWTAKQFLVQERQVDFANCTVNLTLQETAAAIWAWNYGEATTVDLAPNTDLPNPLIEPPALTSLAAASGTVHVQQLSDGTFINRVRLTWTAAADQFVFSGGRIEIEFKRDSDAQWQAQAPVPGDSTSAYVSPVDAGRVVLLRVRPVNSRGRIGPWTTITHLTQGDGTAPATVTGLAYNNVVGGMRVNWDAAYESDYFETEIRRGASWAAGIVLWVGAADSHTWVPPADGAYTIWAVHRDFTGNESTPVSLSTTYTAVGSGPSGLSVAQVYIYRRSATSPTLPSATATFTFASGGITGLNNSWTATVPSGTDPLWVALAVASSASPTDTIGAGEWTSPVVLTQNGVDGSNGAAGAPGLNGATVFLYQRTTGSSAPAAPASSLTYTFATGVLTGTLGDWSQSPPSGSGGYLWYTTAAAASTSATDTIATGEWAGVQKLAQDGANGLNVAQVYIYRRAASSPTLPSATATFTFATGGITGLNNSWTAAVPAGTDPLWVALAVASSTAATDTIATGEWSTPVVLAQDGTTGATGAAGAAGLNGATVFLYQRTTGSSAPAAPASSLTYTFATGVLTGTLGSWSQSPPSGSGGYLWYTTAAAASTSATDTISTGEWAAVQKLAQDGSDGADGADAVSSGTDAATVVLPADSLGIVNAGALPITVTAFAKLGGVDDTANWTWTRGSTSGITTSILGSAVTITAMDASLDAGVVNFTGTKSGYANIFVSVPVTKAKSATASVGPRNFAAVAVALRVSTGTDAVAEVRLNTAGKVQTRVNGGSWTDRANWYVGTISATFKVRASKSGDTLSAGTLGTFQDLTTTRTWTLTQAVISPAGEKSAQLSFTVADSSDNVVGTGSCDLYASYEA